MASPISVESIYEEFDFRSQITRGARGIRSLSVASD